jgi:hypothetical protein
MIQLGRRRDQFDYNEWTVIESLQLGKKEVERKKASQAATKHTDSPSGEGTCRICTLS